MNLGQLIILEPNLLNYKVQKRVGKTFFLNKEDLFDETLEYHLWRCKDDKLEDKQILEYRYFKGLDEFIITIN